MTGEREVLVTVVASKPRPARSETTSSPAGSDGAVRATPPETPVASAAVTGPVALVVTVAYPSAGMAEFGVMSIAPVARAPMITVWGGMV